MDGRFDLSALMRLQRQVRGAMAHGAQDAGDGHLTELPAFGSNPGALRMLSHVPGDLPSGAPLVVALHGCTQTAAGYDRGTGWSDMADRFGFALLLPEQRRTNNAHLCFNWFEPGDTARDAGEALSIRQAVAHMVGAHGLDPARVFVTGLSAGGAMTAVMLAAYPEVFAGGAIVAGLPFGSASGVQEALRVMSRPAALSGASRGGSVRAAGGHRGPWPRVAVWHGEADTTVHPDNAAESVKQWLYLHGLEKAEPAERRAGGHLSRRWSGPDGVARVEEHRIAGMAHGVPLHPGEEDERCGVAGAFLLDVGVSSTHGILEFWGVEPVPGRQRARPARPRAEPAHAPRSPGMPPMPPEAGGPGEVIQRALRAAGLLS